MHRPYLFAVPDVVLLREAWAGMLRCFFWQNLRIPARLVELSEAPCRLEEALAQAEGTAAEARVPGFVVKPLQSFGFGDRNTKALRGLMSDGLIGRRVTVLSGHCRVPSIFCKAAQELASSKRELVDLRVPLLSMP